MKKILVLCFFAVPLNTLSQELRLSQNTGYATGEMKSLKKIMLYTGVSLGAELYIKYDLCFSASAGISLLRFNYTDTATNSVFNSKHFLYIPASVKKYYAVSKRSWVFWEFGVLTSYQIADKKEINIITGNDIEKRHNLGFNFGMLAGFGFKTIFTNKLSVDIGLSSQTDYLCSYKNESDKIKADRRMMVISFYRKLK